MLSSLSLCSLSPIFRMTHSWGTKVLSSTSTPSRADFKGNSCGL